MDLLKRLSDFFEDLSRKHKSGAIDEALESIWNFRNLSPRQLRAKVGIKTHPIWELYTRVVSEQLGLSIETEVSLSILAGIDSSFEPDHIISRDDAFKKIENKDIFKRLFKEEDLSKIKRFLVDYTLSIRVKNILDKCRKYCAEDRFLLIVLYGPFYSNAEIMRLETIIEESGYDNVGVIGLNTYFDLMGIDNSIISKVNAKLGIGSSQDFDDLISDILTGPLSLEEREAKLDLLSDIYEKARTLLEFGTSMDNFLGDK